MDEQPQANKPTISSIRTFKGDVGNVVNREKLSIVGMALKEKERREARGETLPATRRSYRIAIAASIILVIFGIGIVTFLYIFGRQAPTESIQTVAPEPILFANVNRELNITDIRPETVVSMLKKEMRDIGLERGSVENIFFTTTQASTTKVLDTSTFLAAANTSAPDSLVRSLESDFMYGIFVSDKNAGFIMLHTNSYEKTYAELLAWEQRFMAERLIPLVSQNATPAGIDTRPFEDVVVKNIDTRTLRDEGGNVVLMYAFLNRNYLVITSDTVTFAEILNRFTTPKPIAR